MATSTILFGMASYSPNATVFLVISVVARIMQAIGDSVVCVVIPIIMSSLYPESSNSYMGYFQSMIGMGMSFGPMFGSMFYSVAGYAGAFLIFAVILTCGGLVSRILIPEHTNFPSR
jgi:MFS family permease